MALARAVAAALLLLRRHRDCNPASADLPGLHDVEPSSGAHHRAWPFGVIPRESLKLPPCSIEAEQSLLGGLMLDNAALARIAGQVADSDFYRDDHRRIFRHIARLIEAGHPADVVTVYESLEKSAEAEQAGGMAYLGEIANSTPSAANIGRYAEIVRERAILRMLQAVGEEIAAGTAGSREAGDVILAAEQRIAELREQTQPREPRYKLMTAADIAASSATALDLVKGVLPRRGIAAVFGPSMAGKGFLLIDLIAAIGEGTAWFGRTAARVPVVYFVLEGAPGIPKRTRAWEVASNRPFPAGVWFLAESFDLRRADDVAGLVAAIRDAGLAGAMLIIDTLNQASPGADENSSSDMGQLIAAAKTLQAGIDGLVLLVAHTGKDLQKGLRGHSSLIAALDAAVEVRRDGDRREWLIAKAKDAVDGDSHPFKLRVVEIGTDDDGELITSCAVEPAEDIGQAVRRVRLPRGGNQKVVYDIAGELLRDSRHFGQGSAPAPRPCVRLDDLIAACRGRLPVDNDRIPERVRLAVTGLIGAGCLAMTEGWLWHP